MSGSLRIVLDTNVLVSGIAYGGTPSKIIDGVKSGGLKLVTSPFILEELRRVLLTLKRLSHLTEDEVEGLAGPLLFAAECVEPLPVQDSMLRDETDRQVLGTLLASGADYLISGDKDLLVLAGKYSILTPAQFWEKHG